MYLGYKIYTALCITKLAVHIQERKGMGSRPGQSTEAIQHITPIGKRKEKITRILSAGTGVSPGSSGGAIGFQPTWL